MRENISDEILYKILGTELTDSDMINSKVEEAYAVIRKQSLKIPQNKAFRRRTTRVLIGIGSAAAVLLLSFTFCIMNPVMASEIPILGSLFAKVADFFPFGRIPEENTAILYQGEADSPYRMADGDITVTLTEEYASNQAFYIGIRIENVQEFPEMAAYVESGTQWMDVRTKEAYSFRPEPIMTRRRIEGKFEDAHTFIGIMRIDYSEFLEGEQSGYEALPDSFDMTLEIMQIIATLKNSTRPEGMKSEEEIAKMSDEQLSEYWNSLPKEWVGFPNRYQHWYCDGKWMFEVAVAQTDETARRMEVHEINEAGLGLESIELSSVEMTLHMIENATESLITVAFDADGNQIGYGGSDEVYVIAGHDISTLSVYMCRYEDWEEAMLLMENPENGKGFQELIKERALFGTVVCTAE